MPNIINTNGLEIKTQSELITDFTTAFELIYGTDINLSQDTPDGQMMMIFIQATLDNLDLINQVYNSFDPDNAIGNVLDQRVAINGIQRQAGTYTITNITLVNAQSVNIYGLDQTIQEQFTVADNAGNEWILVTTQLGVAAGSNVYSFRSALPGEVLTIPNTITVPVTIVLGVTSINNPTTYTTLGINEETDAELRIRRQKSVSLASQGYLSGLVAALENINGVTGVFVYENSTNVTDGDGVPSHSIWVIVGGSAAPVDIANAIYKKRNAGCGMFGDSSYTVTQIDLSPFIVYWDSVITENLFIQFIATPLNVADTVNYSAIISGIPLNLIPGVYDQVNINQLSTAVQSIDSNALVTSSGFSNGRSQTLVLSGVAASGVFKVNYNGNASADINWNDAIATIQTKVRAISGLSTAVVTGSIASQSIVINLSTLSVVQSLMFVTSNTLATVAPAAITFTYNFNFQNTLTPQSKKYQFILGVGNIIITPIILSPSSDTVAALSVINFISYGGYSTKTWSMQANPSGGSVNSSTGVYTAGGVLGADIVRVTDSLGNTATSTVTVV